MRTELRLHKRHRKCLDFEDRILGGGGRELSSLPHFHGCVLGGFLQRHSPLHLGRGTWPGAELGLFRNKSKSEFLAEGEKTSAFLSSMRGRGAVKSSWFTANSKGK